jgi:capsular polysaccharide export protein
LGPTPARRRARPSLASLVEATLIQYPRYYDPVTGTACPVEVVLDRLADGTVARASLRLRLLSKIQGQLASFAWLWR